MRGIKDLCENDGSGDVIVETNRREWVSAPLHSVSGYMALFKYFYLHTNLFYTHIYVS